MIETGKIWNEEDFLIEVHPKGESIIISKERLKQIMQQNLKFERENEVLRQNEIRLKETVNKRNITISKMLQNEEIFKFDRIV